MKLRKLSLILLLTITLLLAGCQSGNNAGNAGEAAAGDTGGETESADPSGPIAEGDAYRDFTVSLADGGEFTLSDHEGKVILLNFWATWCGPCVGEMPAFERLQETYGEDLVLLAVNSGEDEETVKGFLEETGYTFRVGLDLDYTVFSLYPSEFIPYTVVIGTDGKVAAIHTGADDYDYYSELVGGLLAA